MVSSSFFRWLGLQIQRQDATGDVAARIAGDDRLVIIRESNNWEKIGSELFSRGWNKVERREARKAFDEWVLARRIQKFGEWPIGGKREGGPVKMKARRK